MALRLEVLEHVRTWHLGDYQPCVLVSLRGIGILPHCGGGWFMPRKLDRGTV